MPAQLRDVFLNLAQNAIQAMPKAGADDHCAAFQTAASACASKIQGSALRPRTCEDFRAVLHDQGTGHRRRLSMVYRTIQIHNGEIDVESTVGVGTTFVILLPAATNLQ
jgi:signal transduction histidine kinase